MAGVIVTLHGRRLREALVLVLLAVVIGLLSLPCQAAGKQEALQHARQHLDNRYVCPMHAQIVDDQPGDCPICGMPLEQAVSAGPAATGGVRVSAAQRHSFGVALAHVERGKVTQEVYASGFVEKVSEAQIRELSSKVDAVIADRLVVSGQWVQQGDVLLTLDYPRYHEVITRYLQALEDSALQEALQWRQQLLEMGVSDAVLAAFDEERPFSEQLEIVAPISGEVVWLSDAEAVEVGDKLVVVRSPSLAEVDLRSYSRIARGVRMGNTGRLHVAHLPGRGWLGRVVEVVHNRAGFYSLLRFHVEVPAGVLEPGAFAGAYVEAGSHAQTLRVPASAVIYDEHSARVVVWRGDDLFDVVEVELGYEGHDWVEIRSGLREGDHVVTRAQFLIDSEASLQTALKRLSPAPGHNH